DGHVGATGRAHAGVSAGARAAPPDLGAALVERALSLGGRVGDASLERAAVPDAHLVAAALVLCARRRGRDGRTTRSLARFLRARLARGLLRRRAPRRRRRLPRSGRLLRGRLLRRALGRDRLRRTARATRLARLLRRNLLCTR